jgi:hypothetical protein
VIVEVDRAAGEFRKRAEDAVEADRLGHEAQVLTVARHPGVVQLLSWQEDTLRLRLVEASPLPADHDVVAAVARAAATTLADLHDIGVVHGAVSAEHILVDPGGQAVLCGFGQATSGGGSSAQEAADVVALARALPAPAVVAAAGQAGRHPHPARRLATLLALPPPGRSPVVFVSSLVATAVMAAVVLATLLARFGAPAPAPMATPAPTSTRAPTPTRAPGGPVVPACPAVDLGCQPLPRPDGILTTPAGRYRIGQPSDVVVLGRWHCAAALPALLRPATGEVWVWDSWAVPTGPRPARLVGQVPGAQSIAVQPESPGCDRLQVVRADGQRVAIHPEQLA